MNFVFFSVHFPDFIADFSHHLNQFGVKVLGIGDTGYHHLDDRLKSSLTDYYQVSSLENYDEVVRAVGYFTFKHGRIDRFESLNEYWLELEARIRTDFNIEGVKSDFIQDFRRKSRMKHFFEKSGVKTIPYIKNITREKIRAFIKAEGYPIIVKPDKGAGAQLTYKISNDEELEDFLINAPEEVEFIAEAFIDAAIVTYDGLVGLDGEILFESSTVYDVSIMDVVNFDDHVSYISFPEIPEDLRKAGRKIIKAFKARERFFHIELFRSRKNDELIALEVNMRPPGAWMTDAMNFSYDMDIYREWANMVANGRVDGPFKGRYYTTYVSRKDHKFYQAGHETILQQMNGNLVKHAPIAPIFARAMGNYAYQLRSESLKEIREIISFIHEEI